MTLDKAIKHYKEKAEGYERQIRDEVWEPDSLSEHNCIKNAEECRQLEEWLKELKRLKEQQPCEDCISREDAKNALANLGIDVEDYWEDAIDGLPPVELKKECKGCKYEETGNNTTYPCSHCCRCYTDKYKAESEG